jgi:hypothetical protein
LRSPWSPSTGAAQIIALDGTGPVAPFDGLGSVSGGGATSVLYVGFRAEAINSVYV